MIFLEFLEIIIVIVFILIAITQVICPIITNKPMFSILNKSKRDLFKSRINIEDKLDSMNCKKEIEDIEHNIDLISEKSEHIKDK